MRCPHRKFVCIYLSIYLSVCLSIYYCKRRVVHLLFVFAFSLLASMSMCIALSVCASCDVLKLSFKSDAHG